jgi:GNAT superfamily N-acetyltransferase
LELFAPVGIFMSNIVLGGNARKDELVLRIANIQEWKEIVEFFDTHLHNLYHDPGFVPSGLIRDKIQGGNVVVAEREKKIVGVAITNGETLWNLVVHKEFRRKNIGSALLKGINPKYIRIKAKGGFPDPTPFYVKNGYKPVKFVESNVTRKKTILLAAREDVCFGL